MQAQVDDTAITHHDGGTTLTGDAITLFRAVTLMRGIKLYIKTKMVLTRGITIKKMLILAADITRPKKMYTNNLAGWEQAAEDLRVWTETLKAAIPHVDETTK